MMKLSFAIGLLGLVCLIPGSLRANTVYTYTGNPYTTCSYVPGGDACLGGVHLSLTFDTSLTGTELSNFSGDMVPYLQSFFAHDVGGPEGNVEAGGGGPAFILGSFFITFDINTNAFGGITSWDISLADHGHIAHIATNNNMDSSDSGEPGLVLGFNNGDPGSWSPTAVIPEPGTASLTLIGIGLVIGTAVRRSRGAPRGFKWTHEKAISYTWVERSFAGGLRPH